MRKVNEGSAHESILSSTDIEGVTLMQFPVVEYQYGFLSEILNPSWANHYREPIEHMYFINNEMHSRSEWHVHLETVDRYVLLSGQIDLALFDNREGSRTKGTLLRIDLVPLGVRGWHGLRIPPGVWHTFRTTEGSFSLLNNKFPGYDRKNPDKYTIPFENETARFSW